MLGGEVLDGVDTDVQMQAAEGQDSQEMAMRTADKLLKELRPKPGQFNILIWMVKYRYLQHTDDCFLVLSYVCS